MQSLTIAAVIVAAVALTVAAASLIVCMTRTQDGRPVQFTVTHLTDRPRRSRRFGDLPDTLGEDLDRQLGLDGDKSASPRHAAPAAAAAATDPDPIPAPVAAAQYAHPYPDPYSIPAAQQASPDWQQRPAAPWPGNFGQSQQYPSGSGI